MKNYLKHKEVFVDNVLIMGRFLFTSKQIDLLFIILAHLQKDKTEYQIHISQLEELTKSKWNYSRLKIDTKIIGSKVFEIEFPNKSVQLWLFQSIIYENNSGCFTIKISEAAKPYLFNLKSNFTTIELSSILRCTSVYAKRIYCLASKAINKNRGSGYFSMNIVELKKILKFEEAQTKNKLSTFSHFRKTVLEIAEVQINEFTNLNINITAKKKYGRFSYLEFNIRYKNKFDVSEDYLFQNEHHLDIEHVKSYGFTNTQAIQISKGINEKEFQEIISGTQKQLTSGKINGSNLTAYLVGIFQNKGIIDRKYSNISESSEGNV